MKKRISDTLNEISEAFCGTGLVTFLIGAALADSDNIAVPVILLLAAIGQMFIGFIIEWGVMKWRKSR